MSNSLVAWLEIEQRILKARTPVETAFIAVNLTHAMVPYRQAILWSGVDGVLALSGIASVEPGSPYVLWLAQVFRHLAAPASPERITSGALPPSLAAEWQEWLPIQAVMLPANDEILFFSRDESFSDEEIVLLERLADLVSLSRRALKQKNRFFKPTSSRWKWLALPMFLIVAVIPVTGSVLAPAESVPAHPTLVRAPLDGVVDRIHIKPNEPVTADQPLFDLDATTLTGRLEVSRQQYATAMAEYRQSAQAMVFDAKVKSQVAILASKAEEKAAEVHLLENQLSRIHVKAPQAGIAVFDEVSDWLGKPVIVGEKIMIVADETDTEVEAWLSVADVGEVKIGSALTLFLNTEPLSPVKATVRTIAYQASVRPDSTLAHRVRAVLADDKSKPRLGLKGTARIDGETVPLAWWLFRRPIGRMRQFLGL